jgi:triosephosphate isomerase (TIM)
MRKPLISGNWKMNLHHFEAIAVLEKLMYLLPKEVWENVDVSVHPPFTDLRSAQTVLGSVSSPIFLGAQHCHFEDSGAYTGEVSPLFLAKLRVDYVICGHSERREMFGETDELVTRRIAAIHRHGMFPIMCVGESLAEREAGETEVKVLGQVQAGLRGCTAEQVANLVIAYEPIWAIGTGRTATAQDAQVVCEAIRGVVADGWGADAAASVRIQYGGSVKADSTAELMAMPDVDGALVGGASLDPGEFARIVQIAAQ